MYAWDDRKRESNLEKHGLDFLAAIEMFDGRPIISIPAKTMTESRTLTVGRLYNGKLYTVVWTQRGDALRIISFRRARHGEENQYLALFGR